MNDLTPAMLAGTPVGGPGGFAACDTCNRRLTDGHREHDPDDAEADTVYAYAARVRGMDRWSLRWVSCEECGPPGDTEDDSEREPGEVVATATLTFDARIDGFTLADPDDAEADTVYAYATRVRDTDRWSLRWVSCEECGPPGDAEDDSEREPGEVVATATLTFDTRIDGFALADPTFPTDAEDGETYD